MRKILFWLGILVLLYVGLGLIAGLIPVEGWSFILDLFIERSPNEFYRIVPAEDHSIKMQMAGLTILGAILIGISKSKARI